MRKPIADLHCHPSLKPANNAKIKDIWTFEKNLYTKALFKGFLKLGISPRKWAITMFVKDMATYTQSNLDSCYEGNARLLFMSIYPPERPFLKPDRPFKGTRGLKRTILKSVFGLKTNRTIDHKIIRLLAGFSSEKAKGYLKDIYDKEYIQYFDEDYKNEYHLIVKNNLSSSSNDKYIYTPKFKLVKNFEAYKEITEHNEIAGIITVEGMHALANYRKVDLFQKETINDLEEPQRIELEASFKHNINTIKKPTAYTPFFITFSHHFNNLISGHAKSFADAKSKSIPGFSDVFNQKIGLNLGLTNFAVTLINDYLLSRVNGPRILIDTKHMSLQARDDYSKIVKEHQQNGDQVPIICSHTAINGIPTRKEAKNRKDINEYDAKSYVSRWDINITDEDIIEIFDSQGVIGVCMHDGRMPGGKFKKLLKGFKKGFEDIELIKRLHVQMFLTNIFHIAKINLEHIRGHNQKHPNATIAETEAWATICLGTDNDGIVDPFDHFNKADTLGDFQYRVGHAITVNFKPYRKEFRIISITKESYSFFEHEELLDLMVGFTPEEIADKVFSDNVYHFLSKYFTKNYLEG